MDTICWSLVSRLSGASNGYLSAYTMPAAQSVTLKGQKRINEKEGLMPEYRNLLHIVGAKTNRLLSEMTDELRFQMWGTAPKNKIIIGSADIVRWPANSIDLVVTSPPFLDVVDYKTDNWLRGWFCGIDTKLLPIWQMADMADWRNKMFDTLSSLYKCVKPNGYVCYEVGEVKDGNINLDEEIIKLGMIAGFKPVCIVINMQEFNKVAALWGVKNNELGTNTNRICVFQK